AVVPDDDHAAQGYLAGDRLPRDGERAVLRRDRRDVRDADGGRARRRARRAGRHADPRRVLLPDPRAVRQPRSAAHGTAQGGLTLVLLALLLGTPLLGSVLLALLGARAWAAWLNIAISALTFAAGAALALVVVRDGPLLLWHEQFFVDPFNVFLVVLTAFVGLTTSLFSRPYM